MISWMLRKVVDVKFTWELSLNRWLMVSLFYCIPRVTSLLVTLYYETSYNGELVIKYNPTNSHKVIAELLGSGAVNTMDNLMRI